MTTNNNRYIIVQVIFFMSFNVQNKNQQSSKFFKRPSGEEIKQFALKFFLDLSRIRSRGLFK
jgi:hypothetical protein